MYKKVDEQTQKVSSFLTTYEIPITLTMSRSSTPVYDYPSHAVSPYQEQPANPPTPELQGTFINQPYREWRCTPLLDNPNWQSLMADMARHAQRIAVARIVFNSTIQ